MEVAPHYGRPRGAEGDLRLDLRRQRGGSATTNAVAGTVAAAAASTPTRPPAPAARAARRPPSATAGGAAVGTGAVGSARAALGAVAAAAAAASTADAASNAAAIASDRPATPRPTPRGSKGGAVERAGLGRQGDHGAALGLRALSSPAPTPSQVNHQGRSWPPPSRSTSARARPRRTPRDAIDRAEADHPAAGHDPRQLPGHGQELRQQSALSDQPLLILAAIVAIYIVLGILYESYVHPLTILSTLPSAGVGACWPCCSTVPSSA